MSLELRECEGEWGDYEMLAAPRRPIRRALLSLGGVGGWKASQLRLRH